MGLSHSLLDIAGRNVSSKSRWPKPLQNATLPLLCAYFSVFSELDEPFVQVKQFSSLLGLAMDDVAVIGDVFHVGPTGSIDASEFLITLLITSRALSMRTKMAFLFRGADSQGKKLLGRPEITELILSMFRGMSNYCEWPKESEPEVSELEDYTRTTFTSSIPEEEFLAWALKQPAMSGLLKVFEAKSSVQDNLDFDLQTHGQPVQVRPLRRQRSHDRSHGSLQAPSSLLSPRPPSQAPQTMTHTPSSMPQLLVAVQASGGTASGAASGGSSSRFRSQPLPVLPIATASSDVEAARLMSREVAHCDPGSARSFGSGPASSRRESAVAAARPQAPGFSAAVSSTAPPPLDPQPPRGAPRARPSSGGRRLAAAVQVDTPPDETCPHSCALHWDHPGDCIVLERTDVYVAHKLWEHLLARRPEELAVMVKRLARKIAEEEGRAEEEFRHQGLLKLCDPRQNPLLAVCVGRVRAGAQVTCRDFMAALCPCADAARLDYMMRRDSADGSKGKEWWRNGSKQPGDRPTMSIRRSRIRAEKHSLSSDASKNGGLAIEDLTNDAAFLEDDAKDTYDLDGVEDVNSNGFLRIDPPSGGTALPPHEQLKELLRGSYENVLQHGEAVTEITDLE